MLIQLITEHPQAIGPILRNTPGWVWGLLAALLALGISQVRSRMASMTRISVMPIAMGGLAIYGMVSAFGNSPNLAAVFGAWMLAALATIAVVMQFKLPEGTRFDAQTRSFHIPGSFVPLLLILGIFLTKYVVGVEVAMKPPLASDPQYTLVVGALYGAFNGIFTGRSLRLLRLARTDNRALLAAA